MIWRQSGHFAVERGMLGLARSPSRYWPDQIWDTGVGNDMPFIFSRIVDLGDGLEAYAYVQQVTDIELWVHNE